MRFSRHPLNLVWRSQVGYELVATWLRRCLVARYCNGCEWRFLLSLPGALQGRVLPSVFSYPLCTCMKTRIMDMQASTGKTHT